MRSRLGVVVAVLAVATKSLATEATIYSTKTPDADACPDTPELAATITTLSGRPTSASSVEASADVVVDFSRDRQGYSATLRTKGPGVRTVQDAGKTCADLAEAVAAALVVLLDDRDDGASQAPATPAPVVTVRGSDAPKGADATLFHRDAPPARKEPRLLSIEAGSSVGAGLLGSLAPAAFLDVHVAPWRTFSFSAGGSWFFNQSFDVAPGSVVVSLRTAWIEACVEPFRLPIVELGVCAASAVGALSAEGQGFSTDTSSTRLWYSLAGGAELRGPFAGRLGWLVRAEAVVPLLREGFGVREGASGNVGVAYQPGAVAFLLDLGVRASIW